jgi:hypothetical protein
MALVINDRVKETSTTSGTGTLDLAGAVTGFVTFVAGIGDTNTTYYAIFEQGTANWEVGLGTVTDAATDTLARTTVISNSLGNTDKISFGGETADVFCTLPASKAVFGKQEGTNFTGSLLVGHSTSGTLDAATYNTGVGIGALDAITSADHNTAVGADAGTGITTGFKNTFIGFGSGRTGASNFGNVGVGYYALYGVNNSGIYNTALGYTAGISIGSGDYNVLLGFQAGDNITTGSGNVVIGKADVPSATGDDQLSISDGADGAAVWITGESTGNVEINKVWNPSLSTTGKAFVMGF